MQTNAELKAGQAVTDRATQDSAVVIRRSERASKVIDLPGRRPMVEEVYECRITKRTKNSHYHEDDVVLLTNPRAS